MNLMDGVPEVFPGECSPDMGVPPLPFVVNRLACQWRLSGGRQAVAFFASGVAAGLARGIVGLHVPVHDPLGVAIVQRLAGHKTRFEHPQAPAGPWSG